MIMCKQNNDTESVDDEDYIDVGWSEGHQTFLFYHVPTASFVEMYPSDYDLEDDDSEDYDLDDIPF